MTKDEIIRMAQTCGFSREDHHAIYGMLAKFGDMVAAAAIDKRVKVKLGEQYGLYLGGNWFYLQPADEFANAALYKHTGVEHDAR